VIPILFADDDIIVVDKPDGLAAIPERQPGNPSAVDLLSAQRGEKLYVVHRLDKETSGVMVFARNAEAHRRLNKQFEARTFRKVYLALVHGVVEGDRGQIDAPLRPFGSGRMGVDVERGKPSVTEYDVLERFASHTLLEARPRTGRRHQIRVHLYHTGHPIVGDPLYGHTAAHAPYPRLMLHARAIGVPASSGADLTFQAPPPESYRCILETIPRH
jgi:RluA family pseudouridine synthase